MIAASHRPVLADFDAVLNADRITRMRATYRWLFVAFLTVAVLGTVAALTGLAINPAWFAAVGADLFVGISLVGFLLATVGCVFVGSTARADREAEAFVAQVFVEDIAFEYGFAVPARRVPLEVGEVSQADVLIDGERRMVALVLPADDQPMVVIPVKSERPLLPLRAVVA